MEENHIPALAGDIDGDVQDSEHINSVQRGSSLSGVDREPSSRLSHTGSQGSVFSRLSPAIIKRILYSVDANCFTSLTLLNREWRRVSTCPQLYRHHLSDYVSSLPDTQISTLASDSIEALKYKLARVAKQHVFSAFLQPKLTVVKLISASVSSSSASPQGEALRFTFSARGGLLLALTSSRIFVVDLAEDPISVRHELKILRRPTAAAILDDGTLLAVASSEHRVRIYTLAHQRAELLQTIELHEIPLTLEFSPYASVLAIAFNGGVEVYALGENILSTAHRAVRCDGVSALSFSSDGSMLFGSSINPRVSSFITISPPLLPDPGYDLTLPELHSRMWTTQILFPEVGEGYSSTCLIPPAEGGDQSIYFVGYDPNIKAFRIAQVDDLTGSSLYLVGPGADADRDEPGPNLLPVASAKGEFIAASFEGSGIWIYGIPTSRTKAEDLNTTSQSQPRPTILRINKDGTSLTETTNFQRLKKHIEGPKAFVQGHPLEAPSDITHIRWMRNTNGRKLCRLVAVAPGGVDDSLGMIAGDPMPIDGGRVILFDFELSTKNGVHEELTIEAGEAIPTELPEQKANLDAEVELEKRRTQISRQRTLAARNTPLRETRRNSIPPLSPNTEDEPSPPMSATSGPRGILPFLDSPYSNTSPRSIETLRRAATAASRSLAASRFANARPALNSGPRRRQFVVPHESDADNWVPPPPPYTPDAEEPLPEHFRASILPRATEPLPTSPSRDAVNGGLRRSRTSTIDSTGSSSLHRSQTSMSRPSVAIPRRPFATNSANNSPIERPSASQSATMPPSSSLSGGNWQSSYNNHVGFHPPIPGPILPPHSSNSADLHTIDPSPEMHSPQPRTHLEYSQQAPSMGLNAPSHHLVQERGTRRNNRFSNTDTAQSVSNQIQQSNEGDDHSLQSDSFQRPSYISAPAASSSYPLDSQDPLPSVPQPPIEGQISENSYLPESGRQTAARSSRWLTANYRPADSGNPGVGRSRSRSQDIPRHRFQGAGGGLYDRRTGRNILTSQSDIRINTTNRSDDWKEQWHKLKGERRKNKDSKCVVM